MTGKRLCFEDNGVRSAGIALCYCCQCLFHHSASLVRSPTVLRVGVLPDNSVDKLHQRYAPLLDHLFTEAGLEYKRVLPATTGKQALLKLAEERIVDLLFSDMVVPGGAYIA